MSTLLGYTIHKCLQRTLRSEIFAGERTVDHRAVRLKVYPRGDVDRARRELHTLQRAAGPGVVDALALDLWEEQPVLVLARARGISLASFAESPTSMDVFLRVAESLCTALDRIHAAHIVHRDIKPANMVVDPSALDVCIVDFDVAADLGAVESCRAAEVVGSPAYMAPEQTGRIQHGVDFRSDLYGVGATLFELLTQRPPFGGRTTNELIHAHLATAPPSPSQRRPEVPPAISQIVLRLLQKQPEDRYQSAAALLADLGECRAQLARCGSIVEFRLGRSDVPRRPAFPRTLFGREPELLALYGAFDRAAERESCEAMWLLGTPGMGKSALVDELRMLVAERGGYVAWCKFDLYRRDRPYAGLRSAFDSLAQQWLTEDDTRLDHWRSVLSQELGAVAPVVVELAPEFAFVLPRDLPTPPPLPPRETRARLSLAVQRLVRAAAREAAPLILVLDDLQWADLGSLALIEELLVSKSTPSLLVIGTYRSNEVDRTHPVSTMRTRLVASGVVQHEIAVGPLSIDATAAMLAEALGRTREATRSLAERIVRKTAGTPLLIQQLVLHLHALGGLRYVVGRGWEWDDAAIAAAHIPEGAVGMLIAKLERLAPRERELLQLASCVADEFCVERILELTERPRDVIEPGLWALCEEALIVPSRGGYRFAHDRIREAAHELLSEADRAELHAEAARLLVEHTPQGELEARCMEIADHMNLGASRLSAAVGARALEINLAAGRRALAAGAAATAQRYLRTAYARLHEDDWTARPAVALELVLLYIDSAHQMREFALARALVDEVARRPLGTLERANVAAKRIAIDTVELRDAHAFVRQTLETLASFGVRWPENPSWLRQLIEVLRTDWALRDRLLGPPHFPQADPNDTSWLPPLIIMGASTPVIGWARPGLARLVAAYCLRAYARHGYRTSPALVLAGFAPSHRYLLGRTARSDRYAAAAEEWCATERDPIYGPRARTTLYTIHHGWTRPRRELIEPLARIAHDALEVGDFAFASIVSGQHVLYSALVGEPLAVVEARYAAHAKQTGPSRSVDINALGVRILRDGFMAVELPPPPAIPPGSWDPSSYAFQTASFLATALCMVGEHETLITRYEALPVRALLSGAAFSYVADFGFFYGLAAAELAATPGGRRALGRRARMCARYLRRYARSNTDFEHMALGLAAESSRMRGRRARAQHQYTTAARLAQKRGYRHHAALLHERHAYMLAADRRDAEASSLLRRAAALYDEWGARAKAAALLASLGGAPRDT
jgi:hypothetical protein